MLSYPESITPIESLEGGCTETQNVLKAAERTGANTEQYRTAGARNYTMDVFLERSEALAQQIAASTLPSF